MIKLISSVTLFYSGLYRLIIANLLRFIRKDANLDMLKDHLTVFEEGVTYMSMRLF